MYLSDPRVDDLITVHNNKSPYVFRVTQKEVPSVSSMPNLGVFKWLFDMLYAYKHCKIAGYLWRKGVKFVPLTFLLQAAVKTWETRGVKKVLLRFFVRRVLEARNVNEFLNIRLDSTPTTNFRHNPISKTWCFVISFLVLRYIPYLWPFLQLPFNFHIVFETKKSADIRMPAQMCSLYGLESYSL